jgi:hypothetical protein
MSHKIVGLLICLALILPAGGMASAQEQYLPVVGAISLSNTQVRVVFNRSMGIGLKTLQTIVSSGKTLIPMTPGSSSQALSSPWEARKNGRSHHIFAKRYSL